MNYTELIERITIEIIAGEHEREEVIRRIAEIAAANPSCENLSKDDDGRVLPAPVGCPRVLGH